MELAIGGSRAYPYLIVERGAVIGEIEGAGYSRAAMQADGTFEFAPETQWPPAHTLIVCHEGKPVKCVAFKTPRAFGPGERVSVHVSTLL